MEHVWRPLLLSLRIATAATVLTAVAAVPLAFAVARLRLIGNVFVEILIVVVEALIIVPLVLPPTVVGFLLIMALGSGGWVGGWLDREFGYTIMFRTEGAVLAAAVVALPMLYLPAKAAFAAVDRDLEDTARLMGAGRLRLFWHVSLPLARRGLASGLILAFARALGEFGATMMVFGWLPGRETLPISIWGDYANNELEHATAAVVTLTAVSLLLVGAYNWSSLSRQE